MTGIKHATQIVGENNPAKQISATPWNEEHSVDDAGIPMQKVLIPVQTIDGPDWTDPTGTSQIVIQQNTATGEVALCWFDGVSWSRVVNQVSGGSGW